MITSEAQVHDAPRGRGAAERCRRRGFEGGGVWIRVRLSSLTKCVRCWQHRPDVGASAQHPQICGRCVSQPDIAGRERGGIA